MVIRRLCRSGLAAGILGVAFCCPPASDGKSSADPCATHLPGRFSEFLIRTDGAIILFPADHNGVARVWQGGNWREDTTLATEGIVRDAIHVGNGRWRLASQVSSEEVVLYEYSGSGLKGLGRLSGIFEKPTLHQARDGCIWITSAEGRAYGFKDGKALTREFGAEVNKKKGCYTYYPPTLSLDVPDRGLWFWSQVQHEALNFGGGPKPAIEGF